MDLEKVASELAQKAVAVRNSDIRLAPGEYPVWAYEFRKLAEEHYAELGLTKEAAGESYNPYSLYDQAAQGNEVMSNPLVRNSLVTGGLGAGVGALGSLASNLFSKKKKKRYLSDALSAGLMGGLAGGAGGAGYTALTDNKATNDLLGQASKLLGGGAPPPANRNLALAGERAAIENKAMAALNPALSEARFYGNLGATGVGLAKPVAALSKGLATGQLTTKADTSKMLIHAEQQFNAFRDSLAESSKKGVPKGNRQIIFDDFLHQHNLMPDRNSGVIKVRDPSHLTAAMQDLKNLNLRTEAPPLAPVPPGVIGNRLTKAIDTDTLLKNLMGTGGATSGPGVLQSFSNPELAARRLESASKGSALSAGEAADFINKGYPKPSPKFPSIPELYRRLRRIPPSGPSPIPPNIPPSANSKTYYDGKGVLKAIRPSAKGSATSLGLAAISNYGLPWLNEHPEARSENAKSFVENLRSNLATAKAEEIGGNREKILGALDNLRNNMGDTLTTTELRDVFEKIEEIVPQKEQK